MKPLPRSRIVFVPTLLGAFVAFPLRAQGPVCEQWRTATYHPTGWGSNALFLQTYATATVVNAQGSPTNTGSYLDLQNASPRYPLYYGLAAVLDGELAPASTTRLPVQRPSSSTQITQVNLLVKWCDKEGSGSGSASASHASQQGSGASSDGTKPHGSTARHREPAVSSEVRQRVASYYHATALVYRSRAARSAGSQKAWNDAMASYEDCLASAEQGASAVCVAPSLNTLSNSGTRGTTTQSAAVAPAGGNTSGALGMLAAGLQFMAQRSAAAQQALEDASAEERRRKDAWGDPDRATRLLHYAVEIERSPEAIQQALDSGAAIDARNEFTHTALASAVRNRDGRMVRLLLELGANPNVEDEYGKTAIIEAAEQGAAEITMLLIAAGADVHHHPYHPSFSESALDIAHHAGFRDIESILKNVDREDRVLIGIRAKFAVPSLEVAELNLAAGEGDTATVTGLLCAGVPVDSVDEFGFTPLQNAAFEGQAATVEQLIAAGADVNVVNLFGQSALLLAMRGEYRDPSDVARLLVQARAFSDGKSLFGESVDDEVKRLKNDVVRRRVQDALKSSPKPHTALACPDPGQDPQTQPPPPTAALSSVDSARTRTAATAGAPAVSPNDGPRVSPRTDGFYCGPVEQWHYCLRFFDDGSFVAENHNAETSEAGYPDLLSARLVRGASGRGFWGGSYQPASTSFELSFHNGWGKMTECSGIFTPGAAGFTLRCVAHPNTNEVVTPYHFVPAAGAAPTR